MTDRPIHSNDPAVVNRLLDEPGTWAVVGLSGNRHRAAYSVASWLHEVAGKELIAIHPSAQPVLSAPGYARLADIPSGPVTVVDCFVNSHLVGTVVDEAIEEHRRLGITALWLQLGVIDEAAAARAQAAGLDVVMNTCPKIEDRRR
ncbi:MAG: CoA-binding protein [Nostocoides sp.]